MKLLFSGADARPELHVWRPPWSAVRAVCIGPYHALLWEDPRRSKTCPCYEDLREHPALRDLASSLTEGERLPVIRAVAKRLARQPFVMLTPWFSVGGRPGRWVSQAHWLRYSILGVATGVGPFPENIGQLPNENEELVGAWQGPQGLTDWAEAFQPGFHRAYLTDTRTRMYVRRLGLRANFTFWRRYVAARAEWRERTWPQRQREMALALAEATAVGLTL